MEPKDKHGYDAVLTEYARMYAASKRDEKRLMVPSNVKPGDVLGTSVNVPPGASIDDLMTFVAALVTTALMRTTQYFTVLGVYSFGTRLEIEVQVKS
jgi:hypothetical protein